MEILSSGTITRNAINDVLSGGLVRTIDEGYVGLIARYTNDPSSWPYLLALKDIPMTKELFCGMKFLRQVMKHFQNVNILQCLCFY